MTIAPRLFGGCRLIPFALIALAFLTQEGWSQTWSTGYFNTNQGWVSGTFLQGQNASESVQWQGNDPEVGVVGGTDYLTVVIGYTPSGTGNRSLVQGGLNAFDGYIPATNSVRLWRPFTPLEGGTATFFTEWSLIGSLDLEYPDADTFAFDLRTADNAQSLVRFELTPGVAVIPNAYTLQWVRDGNFEANVIDLGYQAVYQMQVDITGSAFDLIINQINASTRAVLTNWTLITGGSLSTGTTVDDFGTVGIDWDLASGNPEEPGSNYIVVNEVSVVPEPSTYVLLVLAGVGAAYFARRRSKA